MLGLFESYIHRIAILFRAPWPASARSSRLYLFGDELNIYSFVGLVMLVGISEEERDA